MLISSSLSGAVESKAVQENNRRFVRVPLVGILFGLPLAIATPASPFFRKSVKQNKNPQYLFMASFLTHTIGSMLGYYLVSETAGRNKHPERLRPNLTYTNCIVPGLGALMFSHCCYPGVFVVLGERNLRNAGREYRRLTWRCLLAFAPAHLCAIVPFSFLLAALFGVKKEKPAASSSS